MPFDGSGHGAAGILVPRLLVHVLLSADRLID